MLICNTVGGFLCQNLSLVMDVCSIFRLCYGQVLCIAKPEVLHRELAISLGLPVREARRDYRKDSRRA
uniref:Uncharacterized protein n=1 Tax=Arundo donax TaxID=35708 RepID=A0A0A9A2K9_ARUDO